MGATRFEQTESERQSASLAGLAVTLFLVVIGLYLVDSLRVQARLQDCLLSGERVCPVQGAP